MSSKKATLLSIAFIIIVGLICYGNTLVASFHFDDYTSICNNTLIKNISNINEIWLKYTGRFIGYYSFALNYHFGQSNVQGYHIVNILIHLLSSILVFRLFTLILLSPKVKSVNLKNRRYLPLFAAIIFISHPIQTQAVTYIVQRLASLVALFYLLSITLYMQYALIREKKSDGSKISKFYYVLALISAVFAMFTKENSATLPITIVMVEYFFFCPCKAQIKSRLSILIPFILLIFVVPLTILIKTSHATLSLSNFIPGNYQIISRSHYLFTQFNVICTYLRLLFLPINQNLDYNYPISTTLFQFPTLISFLFLLTILIFAIKIFKSKRILSFGIFFFFLSISVESSIISIQDVIFEHRLYLPLVGFSIVVSYLIFQNLFSFKIFRKNGNKLSIFSYVFLFLVIFILSFLTIKRNSVWQTETTLWHDVLKKSSNKSRVHANIGVSLSDKGMFNEAIVEYKKALAIDPSHLKSNYNSGVAYDRKGDLDSALMFYEKVLRKKPDHASSFFGIGDIAFKRGKLDKAIEYYLKVLKIRPKHLAARHKLGFAYETYGMGDKALIEYKKIKEFNPNYLEAYFNTGNIYYRKGLYKKAIDEYKVVLKISPQNKIAHHNIAYFYQKIGLYKKAKKEYLKALEIDGSYIEAQNSLKRLYKDIGE